jgi:hypothetical protein
MKKYLLIAVMLLSVNTLFANEDANMDTQNDALALCERDYSVCAESCESIEDNAKYESCYEKCEKNRVECEDKADQ